MKLTRETDKEILRRVMSEPTFEKVADAMKRENAKRDQGVVDMLRSAGRQALKGGGE
ncbi:hypothetical protein [Brucella intermedia]|uniref:hypothetical protein n=1 Tax=Brucella intermedia TaxID=94625 RepID=UPI00178C6361|nr:hypothetical protein [Brucella intermedia]